MIYYKANRNRQKQYQTYVKILEDHRVCKGALCKEANNHIETIYTNSKRLSALSEHFDLNYTLENNKVYCDMAKGKSLSELLVDDLMHHRYEQFGSKINWFFEELDQLLPDCSYEEANIFGHNYNANIKYTRVANLDFNFDNIFINGKDYKVIDCEWCFDTCIPKQFILYRSLLYFFTKNQNIMGGTIESLLGEYGVLNYQEYANMEESFQTMIYGKERETNYLENFFNNHPLPIQNQYYFQLYYDQGNGFNEVDSIRKELDLENREINVHLNLNQYIHQIRVDLLNIPCLIENLVITINGETIENYPMNGYCYENQIVFLNSDPQVTIGTGMSGTDISIQYTIQEIYANDQRGYVIDDMMHSLLSSMNHTINDQACQIANLEGQKNALWQEIRYFKHHPITYFFQLLKRKLFKK